MIAKADYDLDKKCSDAEMKWVELAERLINKYTKKRNAYVNKKKTEYDRKCKNEIRKLEWKEERVYKKKEKKLNVVEFAMEIMQENARLRDSDSEWRGFCISCDRLCERWEHAGWHGINRWVKSVCLNPININLQCHSCNQMMWPFKTTPKWIATTLQYKENLIKKYSLDAVNALIERKEAYFKKWYETNWDYGQWKIDLYDYIEELIKENEVRWKGKSFHTPRKNRRGIRDKFLLLTKIDG